MAIVVMLPIFVFITQHSKMPIMLKFKYLFVFLLMTASLLAQTPAITTKQGSIVYNHTNNPGPKITPGQTVLINVDTWLNDSLIQRTKDYNGKPREVVIPEPNSMGGALPFQVGDLVTGFNEGMKLLNKGGKAILFIPYALAYGEGENGPIPAKSDLVFYIGLE